MHNFKVTFLGTGNAIPTEKRNHTGILASFSNENILIDCGEGMQRQFKKANISPTKITSILITHWHGDHMLGLPGLLQTLAMSEYSKTLEIYGPKGTRHFMEIIKALINKLNIKVNVHECPPGKIIEKKEYYIEAAEMNHGIPAMAYSIVIKDKIRLDKKKIRKLKLPNSPILGQLQSGKEIIFKGKKIKPSQVAYIEKGKKLCIVLDTKKNENAVRLAKDSDVLIAESTFLSKEKKIAEEYRHLTASDAAEIAKKAKVKKLILTHISQRYEHLPHLIEKEARKVFKNTSIAKDLDVIEI